MTVADQILTRNATAGATRKSQYLPAGRIDGDHLVKDTRYESSSLPPSLDVGEAAPYPATPTINGAPTKVPLSE